MTQSKERHELTPEGAAQMEAVDGYLKDAIDDGRPIEALIATKRLGEIVTVRAKEAARAATDSDWSWSDVGRALGVSRQAAHEKLRAKVHDEIARGASKLERAEERGHAKIARRAKRGRDQLDQAPPMTPHIATARQRIDEWERDQHAKLDRKIEKARDEMAHAEERVQDKLDRRDPNEGR